ncbi:MAG: hypothetical protein CSA58_00725 [Micrococcales bacterium]|nr:MAG: hypothetical protein CSB46_06935 [Micrococcales bacterium]PIE28115.1 MAG: hypothetical protein CSA58_00725 [Micrococcales bacterium]
MSTLDGQHITDAALLAELRAALRAGPADEQVVQAAKAALSLRTLDEELELMSLISDTILDSLAGVRGGPRILVFSGGGVSVELESVEGELVGQIVPPTQATVLAESADGERLSTQTDELGCFAIALPGVGPVRLRMGGERGRLVTEWARFD